MGNLGIRTNGSSGVSTYILGAARQTLVENNKNPALYLRNVVRDNVSARRFEEPVATEEERAERLLADAAALIVIGSVNNELVEAAERQGIIVIPVPVPEENATLLNQRLLNESNASTRARIRQAAQLLANGSAKEIGLLLPALLAGDGEIENTGRSRAGVHRDC